MSGVTEAELMAAYGPATGVPVDVHAELQLVRREVEEMRQLLETLVGIALGELQVLPAGTKVALIRNPGDLAPCSSCGWIASHDDDCPLAVP